MKWSILRREYEHHTEQVHIRAGTAVRDVILGLSDGLVASFAVTSGVAGAFGSARIAAMAGLAEMLGGAVSMGLAAFVSARSQIEFHQSEIERERGEIRRWPERERDEVRAIYRAKGFGGPLLEQIVAHITADPERWTAVMMREELGFTSDSFDPPLRSGLVVGAAYLLGGAAPVVPYALMDSPAAMAVSAAATALALFLAGAAKTLVTARSWWQSGLESMLMGGAAAAVTYGAGALLGPR